MKKHIVTSLIIASLIGVALGIIFYYLQVHRRAELNIFLSLIEGGSILFPSIVGWITAKNIPPNTIKAGVKPIAKNFFMAIGFTAIALLLGSVVSTKLYCTYGACSEFAGLEILMTLIWMPVMVAISALLTFIGTLLIWFMNTRRCKSHEH